VTWRDTFAALKHRNFKLFFIGQLVSLIGSWMQNTAQGWLVYQLTGSKVCSGRWRPSDRCRAQEATKLSVPIEGTFFTMAGGLRSQVMRTTRSDALTRWASRVLVSCVTGPA